MELRPGAKRSTLRCFLSPRTNSSTAGRRGSSPGGVAMGPQRFPGRETKAALCCLSAHDTPKLTPAHTHGLLASSSSSDTLNKVTDLNAPFGRRAVHHQLSHVTEFLSVQADWWSGPDWCTSPLPRCPFQSLFLPVNRLSDQLSPGHSDQQKTPDGWLEPACPKIASN